MRREQGIALVLVLWVIVLLTVIAGAMSMTQRNGVYMTANIRNEREGRALVDAGINFMSLHLTTRKVAGQTSPWPVDGKLRPWEFAGATVWIGAMPESGRIDLNRGSEELLLGLFQSAGLTQNEAESLRDAISDWKDRDNNRRAQGAEDADYKAAGRPLGASDEIFLSVEELQQVQGMTQELYRKIKPALTVHSRQRTVNPFYAPPEVLAALPGMSPEMVASFDEQRSLPGAENDLPLPQGGSKLLSKTKGVVYRVMAEVELGDGTLIQGAAIMNIRRKTPHGFMILEKNYGQIWHLGRAGEGPSPAD